MARRAAQPCGAGPLRGPSETAGAGRGREARQDWILQPLQQAQPKWNQRRQQRRQRQRPPAVESGSPARLYRPPLETRALRPQLREPVRQRRLADALGSGNRPDLPRAAQEERPGGRTQLRGLRLRLLPPHGHGPVERAEPAGALRLVQAEAAAGGRAVAPRPPRGKRDQVASAVVEDRGPAGRRQRRRPRRPDPADRRRRQRSHRPTGGRREDHDRGTRQDHHPGDGQRRRVPAGRRHRRAKLADAGRLRPVAEDGRRASAGGHGGIEPVRRRRDRRRPQGRRHRPEDQPPGGPGRRPP